MTRPTIWACVGLAWVAACTPAEERFTEAEEPASRTPTDQTVPRSGMLVDVEWLAARVGNPDLVVLQVGSDETEYAAGHIPGARFLPVADIVQTTEGMSNELPSVERLDSVFEALGVSDRSHVVLYGAPLPAARTFFTLDYLGHGERTALLEGGVEEWEAGGYPLTSEVSKLGSGQLHSPTEHRDGGRCVMGARASGPARLLAG